MCFWGTVDVISTGDDDDELGWAPCTAEAIVKDKQKSLNRQTIQRFFLRIFKLPIPFFCLSGIEGQHFGVGILVVELLVVKLGQLVLDFLIREEDDVDTLDVGVGVVLTDGVGTGGGDTYLENT